MISCTNEGCYDRLRCYCDVVRETNPSSVMSVRLILLLKTFDGYSFVFMHVL